MSEERFRGRRTAERTTHQEYQRRGRGNADEVEQRPLRRYRAVLDDVQPGHEGDQRDVELEVRELLVGFLYNDEGRRTSNEVRFDFLASSCNRNAAGDRHFFDQVSYRLMERKRFPRNMLASWISKTIALVLTVTT